MFTNIKETVWWSRKKQCIFIEINAQNILNNYVDEPYSIHNKEEEEENFFSY